MGTPILTSVVVLWFLYFIGPRISKLWCPYQNMCHWMLQMVAGFFPCIKIDLIWRMYSSTMYTNYLLKISNDLRWAHGPFEFKVVTPLLICTTGCYGWRQVFCDALRLTSFDTCTAVLCTLSRCLFCFRAQTKTETPFFGGLKCVHF